MCVEFHIVSTSGEMQRKAQPYYKRTYVVLCFVEWGYSLNLKLCYTVF